MAKSQTLPIPSEAIETAILLIRGQKVMLDGDLAALYGVETRVLKQAVRRNVDRFPADFMFTLTWEELELLQRHQPIESATGSHASRSQIVTLKRGRNVKYLPYVFTEQGIAMLSSVLRSPRAIAVNIEIMRAFVRLRELLASHAGLAGRLKEIESKYDKQFAIVFDAIRKLMEPTKDPVREMGFHTLIRKKKG